MYTRPTCPSSHQGDQCSDLVLSQINQSIIQSINQGVLLNAPKATMASFMIKMLLFQVLRIKNTAYFSKFIFLGWENVLGLKFLQGLPQNILDPRMFLVFWILWHVPGVGSLSMMQTTAQNINKYIIYENWIHEIDLIMIWSNDKLELCGHLSPKLYCTNWLI